MGVLKGPCNVVFLLCVLKADVGMNNRNSKVENRTVKNRKVEFLGSCWYPKKYLW